MGYCKLMLPGDSARIEIAGCVLFRGKKSRGRGRMAFLKESVIYRLEGLPVAVCASRMEARVLVHSRITEWGRIMLEIKIKMWVIQ